MDAQTVAGRLDEVQLVDVRYESEWQTRKQRIDARLKKLGIADARLATN